MPTAHSKNVDRSKAGHLRSLPIFITIEGRRAIPKYGLSGDNCLQLCHPVDGGDTYDHARSELKSLRRAIMRAVVRALKEDAGVDEHPIRARLQLQAGLKESSLDRVVLEICEGTNPRQWLFSAVPDRSGQTIFAEPASLAAALRLLKRRFHETTERWFELVDFERSLSGLLERRAGGRPSPFFSFAVTVRPGDSRLPARSFWCATDAHCPIEEWVRRVASLCEEAAAHLDGCLQSAAREGKAKAAFATALLTLGEGGRWPLRAAQRRVSLPRKSGVAWWRIQRKRKGEAGWSRFKHCRAGRLGHLRGAVENELMDELFRWIAKLWDVDSDRIWELLDRVDAERLPASPFSQALPSN